MVICLQMFCLTFTLGHRFMLSPWFAYTHCVLLYTIGSAITVNQTLVLVRNYVFRLHDMDRKC